MRIHFIGIGGIGISAIACIYKQKNWVVSGSDEEHSEITDDLKKQGIKVFIGHKASNLPIDADLVVYSEAVPQTNLELKQAKKLKIKCLSGAMALSDLAKDYFLIAVSGMHGKSTTASMIAQILIKANLDPTFIIGAKPGWRLGKSKYLVIEADDYKAKFLNYKPDILVLTNIEQEHMDYFQNLSHIFKVFSQYIKQVKKYIVGNKDNSNVVKVLEKSKIENKKSKIKFYSLKDKIAGELKKILKVPGEHNISNALAALNVAKILGIKDQVSLKALGEFKGIWRRFQVQKFAICNLKFDIISDYAHHPTEIQATFQALYERYPNKKIFIIFQPHQYQRTFYLFNDFVKTFQQAKDKFSIEKTIITDIYSVKGRETQAIKKKTSSQKLVKAINRNEVEYIKQSEIKEYIKKNIKQIDVLVIMGAGDIYKLSNELK
ncbi:MAG: UDP-N-acetylmuramate--L-alanine ligase [Candidatus Pacebacteria bacterium]|nr:UDP-N-acetylmuramate--L-alanine ligase [Candidatus Paceibacterota bacterium]